MRITVFTSNQPRHIALIEALARIAERVYVVQECTTLFPGQVDDLFRRSEVMQEYFEHVRAAERAVFGVPRFTPPNVVHLTMRMGDVSRADPEWLSEALNADGMVVFGASYIRGPLCERLMERGAINLHMGISPYYRGSSTNFWAMYDGRPDLVGATVHRLTRGLDSGPILFHVLPPAMAWDPFELGMQAVKACHEALVEALASGRIFRLRPVPQDRSLERRYTRGADFSDEIARQYLERLPTPDQIQDALCRRDLSAYVRPVIGNTNVQSATDRHVRPATVGLHP